MAAADADDETVFSTVEEGAIVSEMLGFEECGSIPSWRQQSSLVVWPPGGSTMWGFGGADGKAALAMSDVYKLTLSCDDPTAGARLKVTGVPLDAQSPFGTSFAHTSVAFGDAMFVFGGATYDQRSKPSYRDSSVIKFHFPTMKWDKVVTSGTAPVNKQWHTSVVHEGKMFVFGGNRGRADLHSLDLGTMTWETLPDAPVGRHLHSAVVCRDEEGAQCMLVFGGEDEQNTLRNDLLEYRFDTKTWSVVATNGDGRPCSRKGHGSVSMADGECMLVIGGQAAGSAYPGDVWKLDTRQMTWSQVVLHNPLSPVSTCSYTCPVVAILENSMSVVCSFGGLPRPSPSPCGFLMRSPYPLARHAIRCLCDMSGLLMNDLFADVCFVVSGTKIKAHRAILAVRSEVFTKQFQSGMKDSAVGAEIDIPDCSVAAFEGLLRFVYSGSPWHNDRASVAEAVELLGLADKYLLPVLKRECERFLGLHVTSNNATRLLIEADRMHCDKLKRVVQDFILHNWKKFSKESLECLPPHLWFDLVSHSLAENFKKCPRSRFPL